ncbi:hypothetical protein AB5I41_13370 [Sphingomonas sp. MMS24-JH45]
MVRMETVPGPVLSAAIAAPSVLPLLTAVTSPRSSVMFPLLVVMSTVRGPPSIRSLRVSE